MDNRLNLWYCRENNLGDRLNEYILPMTTGKKIKYSRAEVCDCVAIGSMLDTFFSERRVMTNSIWKRMPVVRVAGTGFICDKKNVKKEEFFRKLDIRGVRGLYSFNRVKCLMENTVHEVVLGDPGLLSSELINKNLIQKKYRVGIIPHHIEHDNQVLANINLKESTIIDVTQEPIECLKSICRCETIISSSLHGLIVADSLHIPNMRIQLSDKIIGGDYKYKDYYSIYNVTGEHKKMDLRVVEIHDSMINSLIDDYRIDSIQVDNIKNSISKYLIEL